MTGASLTPIAAALADAPEAVAAPANDAAPAPAVEGPAGGQRGGRQGSGGSSDGRRIAKVLDWPEDMPVEPLGQNGATYYYLDAAQQLHALAADKHGRAMIFMLFGKRADVLLRHWGKRNADGELTDGFHADRCANALMRRCAELGIIDPMSQVRGPGAWADPAGNLVLHLGDVVHTAGRYQPPGRYDGLIYPAMAPTMRPAEDPESGDAAAEILGMMRSWHWQHPLQPMLVLGWVCQGFVGGALRWRSHVICDGPKGAGKSTLMELIAGLMPKGWLLTASDVTPAAVYQLMQGKAQPVFFDEFEAGVDPRRKDAVLTILRQASSGGTVRRGGDDHKAHSFSVQFPAMISSIVPVSLPAQDESRMARVQLLPLEERSLDQETRMPDISPKRMNRLGARLMRRMLDQWHRWPATLAAYKRALEEQAGFDSRLQDTYGTLLACADLALYDSLPDADEIADKARALAEALAPQMAENERDQDRCLVHLLQSTIDRGQGARRTVTSWLRQAAAFDQDGAVDFGRRKDAREALASIGLRALVERGDAPGTPKDASLLPVEARALVVANDHPGLSRIFHDTPWPGKAGAQGAWVTALRRCEGAEITTKPMKIGSVAKRGTIVPVARFVDWDDVG